MKKPYKISRAYARDLMSSAKINLITVSSILFELLQDKRLPQDVKDRIEQAREVVLKTHYCQLDDIHDYLIYRRGKSHGYTSKD